MASPKQIEANKRNAKKSTGPRTSAGKKKVAMNAIKHGLLAQQVVLPNEDEEEFAEFTIRLARELRPVGELEDLLVGMIAACVWRLRRLQRVEKGLFIDYVHEEARAGVGQQDQKPSGGSQPAAITVRLLEPEEFVEDLRRQIAQAEKRVQEAEERAEAAERLVEQADAIRAAGDAPMGRAFRADAQNTDAFSRLSRYEAHIQRSMFKALDELRRLQVARRQTMPDVRDASASLELEKKRGMIL